MQHSTDVSDPLCQSGRAWVDEAIRRVSADANRSADTHLIPLRLPDPWPEWGIDVYLKDESTHPTGSLKHRLARSLFLYGLCNGWIREGTTIVEASSGSTAVSEAYFARMLGLPFVAVMPRSTSKEKCELIEFQGGACHFVDDPGALYEEARRVAAEAPAASGGGHYMDQFTYAERATDWRGNNNIAESIFEQMGQERHPCPCWIVVGAGTGGTSATIGRYLRYQRHATQLCVVDPENSAFFDGWRSHDPRVRHRQGLAHRGHRPAAGGAVVPAGRRGPDDPGPGRRVHRRHAPGLGDVRPRRRRLHRHQLLGRA